MRLQVGPLPSTSVLSWIAYAREKVDEIAADPFELALPVELLAEFEGYLEAWTEVAQSAPDFCWEADIPSEVAEYQVHNFHQIVSRLAQAAEDRGEPLQPKDGEPFYRSLVTAIIDGLQMEGAATAEYAAHLQHFWPGYADEGVAATAVDDVDRPG